MKILVINGPNLNLLGEREPDKYGTFTYAQLCESIKTFCQNKNIEVEIFQSNIEGEIVSAIQNARNNFNAIVINPAGYTHTSVAIRDALLAVKIPAVEIHISNIQEREDFRKVSITAPACVGQIAGFKQNSYLLGIQAMIDYITFYKE